MTTYTDMTKAELYAEAQERDLDGRSNMTKDELASALSLDDSATPAVELIRVQHDHLRELFAAFADLSDRPSKKKDELVAEMTTLLVKHARMEEYVLYPAVREALPDLSDELDEGIEEHHLADATLAEIADMTSEDERFDDKVHVMIEAMQHHLEEEETDLLPRIEAGLDTRHLLQLGLAMEQAWKVAPTHPHPRAPQTPPANLLVGAVNTVRDLAQDGLALLRRRLRR